MNWKDFGNSLGQGAAAGAVGSAFNTIFAPAMAKLNLKFANKQLGLQQKYARENFQMENDRQDWLLANQMALTKEGLRNSGYSTADPTMSGPSATVSNIAAPGTPGNGATPPGSSFSYGELVQARLAEAQIKNLEAEANKKDAETRGQEIQNWLNETYGAEQWEASIKNIEEDTKKKIAETLYTDQQRLNSIELTAAQVKDINQRLDMDWQKLQPTLQLLAAQTYQAKMAGKASEAQAALSYQLVKESAQKIENLQKELGLTDAQIGVAVAQAQLLGQEKKKLGWDTVKSSTESDLAQFERDVAKSMGIEFYQAKKVAETILPIGTLGALFGRLVPTSSPVKITGFGR